MDGGIDYDCEARSGSHCQSPSHCPLTLTGASSLFQTVESVNKRVQNIALEIFATLANQLFFVYLLCICTSTLISYISMSYFHKSSFYARYTLYSVLRIIASKERFFRLVLSGAIRSGYSVVQHASGLTCEHCGWGCACDVVELYSYVVLALARAISSLMFAAFGAGRRVVSRSLAVAVHAVAYAYRPPRDMSILSSSVLCCSALLFCTLCARLT